VILVLPAVLGLSVTVAAPEIRALRLTSVDARVALRVLTSEDVPAATVVREGEEVVVTVLAPAAAELATPALQAPLQAIGVERQAQATVFRLRVAPEVPFEVRHEPGMTTVLFGEQPAPELRGPVTPELYGQLFPTGAQPGATPAEGEAAPSAAQHAEGVALGRVLLQPALYVSWVDADVTFQSPQPVADRYLQVTPSLTASTPLRDGQLAVAYEPRLRFFSSIPQLGNTSHFANAKLELPAGARVTLHAAYHFTRALLEANVVDPGREYFFNLSPYTYHDASLGADVSLGPNLSLILEGALRTSRFDQAGSAGFFDYDSRTLRAGLGYDLGADLRAVVSYSYERVPPSAERPLVETSAHSVTGQLNGPIGPLMTGTLSAGYSRRTSPQATGRSRSFDGLVLGGSLRRELGHATSLELQLNRAATLSAFETNAYYVTNSVGLALNVPLPLRTTGRGSVQWLRNDYPNAAEALGVPRRDKVFGWSAGLGRQLGARSWLRFDYRHERRESNLPGFDVTTDGFSVQLGISATGATQP
jgi:hypothetical protein